MTNNEDEDLLDLNLSHEPDTTQQNTNNANSSLYPAFQSIDGSTNAYTTNNAYDENAPMLGQVSANSPPINAYDDKIDSSAPIVSVNSNTNQNKNTTTNNSSSSNRTNNNDNKVSAKCWQIDYYRPYFDVDTLSLLSRLKKSILPTSPFLDPEMNEQADLYGPFWIVSTLVFLMAAMGNFARFLNRDDSKQGEWENDIKKISEAASLLYSVSAFLPLFLYFLFRNWSAERGFIELIAIYGYSLFPFVPACMLCVVPWELFQWSVVFIAFGISTWFLVKNLYVPLDEEKRAKPGYYVLGAAITVQFAISLALKIYFFQY